MRVYPLPVVTLLFRQRRNIVFFPRRRHCVVELFCTDLQALTLQRLCNCVVCLNPCFCAGNADCTAADSATDQDINSLLCKVYGFN